MGASRKCPDMLGGRMERVQPSGGDRAAREAGSQAGDAGTRSAGTAAAARSCPGLRLLKSFARRGRSGRLRLLLVPAPSRSSAEGSRGDRHRGRAPRLAA
jgi:hypothetical protein